MAQRGLTRRQAARVRRREQAAAIDVLEQRVLHPRWRIRKETRSRYHQPVADATINRQVWSSIVRELLDEESDPRVYGAKTRFATKSGVSPRTVDMWLAGEVDVKETNVRAVARAYGRGELELLIRVGLFTTDELLTASVNLGPDEELQLILEAPVSDVWKQRLVERMLARQERDRQRRIEDLRFDIEQVLRGGQTA